MDILLATDGTLGKVGIRYDASRVPAILLISGVIVIRAKAMRTIRISFYYVLTSATH